MAGPTILLAVKDRSLHQQVKSLLLPCRFEVIEASGNEAILYSYQTYSPHLLVLESSQNNGADILDLVQRLRRLDTGFSIILVTAHGSEALAVAALRAGLQDYFRKPVSPEEFISAVNRCVSANHARLSCTQTGSIVPSHSDQQQLIGESACMREIRARLLKVAAVDSHVLITGETGTGKELTVQYIHEHSARHSKPLIAINCAALPDGLLESELFGYEKGAFTGAQSSYPGKLKLADGGTVFFDEIGDMTPYAQAKILRVIESKEVYPLGGRRGVRLDIRIIAATSGDLQRLVSENKFRKDLYFRLNIARFHMLPLRERKEDIPRLVDYYLQAFNARFGRGVKGLTDEAMALLLRHDWPGNIRELRNLMETIFIDPPANEMGVADLPDSIPCCGQTLAERDLLISTLHSVNWNRSKAAAELHWSRMTLYRRMIKYQLLASNAEKPCRRASLLKAVSSSTSV